MAQKTDEKFNTLWSTVVFTMVVIGIAGLSWSTFKDEGWLEKFFGAIWEAEARYPMLIVPTVGGTLLMASVFLRGGLKFGRSGILSSLFVYSLMASGAYHLYNWFRHGF